MPSVVEIDARTMRRIVESFEMGDFALRRAEVGESDAVAALQRLSREDTMPFMRGLHTVDEDRAYFRERVFPTCDVWVAESDFGLVGMCAFRPGWVDHLYVHPARHGAGIGTALLAKAMVVNDVLQLWVFQSNAAAIRFYERRGFTLVRRTDGRDNEERQPDALYAFRR